MIKKKVEYQVETMHKDFLGIFKSINGAKALAKNWERKNKGRCRILKVITTWNV